MSEIVDAKELAQILHSTEASILNQISRGREGITVPPSFRLGRRRVWLRENVIAWLRQKANVSDTDIPRRRERPRKSDEALTRQQT
jgi:predicted DNA-binding transcriptional regulator AlpA